MATQPTSELTAEWTVTAQLKLVRPGDGGAGGGRSRAGPVGQQHRHVSRESTPHSEKVYTYKWTSEDPDHPIVDSFGNSPPVISTSFRSNTNKDSGCFVGSGLPPSGYRPTSHPQYSPKCTSTCSIVLTASTDLYPPAPPTIFGSNPNQLTVDESDPFTFNSGHTATVSTSTMPCFGSYSQAEPAETIMLDPFNQRDVGCQTSDCEVYYKKDLIALEERQREMHHLRKMMYEAGRDYSPSEKLHRSPKFMSPTDTVSSKGSNRNKKVPRTVHIDVYCTGSEVESNATSQDNSPVIEKGPKTPRTLFESDAVFVEHRQAVQQELPRKLAPPFVPKLASPIPEVVSPTKSDDVLILPLQKPETELTEAKQMLFDRYLGDQTQRFQAMRNRLKMRRDVSDDALSSNYPNSSYSTFRDMTCSSISSAFAGDETANIYPSDSFEYDNSEDMLRINTMNRNWASGLPPKTGLMRKLKSLSESEDEEEALQEFVFEGFSRLKNASSRSLDISGAESCATVKANEPVVPERPTIDSGNSTLKSYASDLYSRDYLSRARNFGALVRVRKPGHHIGPVRNPECQCDHCRRWMAERNQIRDRAMSTGDVPVSQLEKWKQARNA